MTTFSIHLVQNGDHWAAQWTDPNTGSRRRRGLGSQAKVSRRAALFKCDQLAARFARNPVASRSSGKVTLAQWRETFTRQAAAKVSSRTEDAYKPVWDRLEAHFGADRRLITITKADAAEWESDLLSTDLSESTVRGYLMRAKVIFGEAEEQEFITDNPFRRVVSSQPILDKDIVYVSIDQLAGIMEHCPDDQHRALFALARLAGLRHNEIDRLEWGHIDFDASTLAVVNPGRKRTTKKRFRTVPIDPKLHALLTTWKAKHHATTDGPASGASVGRLYDRITAILTQAGIKPYGKPLHTLRACCGMDWRTKLDAMDVARLMGHSAKVAFENYHAVKAESMAKITGAVA